MSLLDYHHPVPKINWERGRFACDIFDVAITGNFISIFDCVIKCAFEISADQHQGLKLRSGIMAKVADFLHKRFLSLHERSRVVKRGNTKVAGRMFGSQVFGCPDDLVHIFYCEIFEQI
jgi:hypothetical protein